MSARRWSQGPWEASPWVTDDAWGWASWREHKKGKSQQQLEKEQRRNQQFVEALRSIQLDEGELVNLRMPPPPGYGGTNEAWAKGQDNKQDAAKLR
eukprot:12054255-Alexandrium_andersonii.AAC.1